jgi:phosphoribosylformylglycinamidine synthase
MMFAQANSEHCRHKIFNATSPSTAAAAAVAVRHDPPHREDLAAAQRGGLHDNAAVMEGPGAALAAAGLHQCAAVRPRACDGRPCADEGGDAQPPDGDLALSGRGHRRRRRDPRRRRHRPRARPKAGLTGFSVSNLHLPGTEEPWERSRSASPAHRQRAADHDRGPAGRRGLQQRVRPPQPGGYFRVFEQDVAGVRRGYHKPIMIAGGLGRISAGQTSQAALWRRHAAGAAGRAGHAHRHGRRRGQLDGRGQQHRGAGLRQRAARQPRDPAPRAGGHQPLLGAG